VDGYRLLASHTTLHEVIGTVRKERRPFLYTPRCPLLNHHTSGVRMEFYRSENLAEHRKRDPFPRFLQQLLDQRIQLEGLRRLEQKAIARVKADFERARGRGPDARGPDDPCLRPHSHHRGKGDRAPTDREPTVMVDSALFAIRELMQEDERCLLYGQDVGARLGWCLPRSGHACPRLRWTIGCSIHPFRRPSSSEARWE
jgi:2-oxoisovalerate dehydrogenase E1 component